MPRMADRMMQGCLYTPYWAPPLDRQEREAYVRQVQESISASQIVVADNVCEYLYAGTDQEVWDPFTDFPCLTPPFPQFWIEMRRPSRIVSTEYGEKPSRDLPYCWGVLCQGITVEEAHVKMQDPAERGAVYERMRQTAENMAEDIGPKLKAKLDRLNDSAGRLLTWDEVKAQVSKEELSFLELVGACANFDSILFTPEQYEAIGAKWGLSFSLFSEPEKGIIVGPLGHWVCVVNAQGMPIPYAGQQAIAWGEELKRRGGIGFVKQTIEGLRTATYAPLLTISFFHCKNVKIESCEPPVKLARAYEKRHGIPMVTYKTLEITPMQRVLHTEGRAGEHGLAKALHICRGHFKDYRQKGLFGRRFGIYWWDMHVRGQPSAGAVIKDYVVSNWHPGLRAVRS